MVLRLVASVVGCGGVLIVDGDRLVCRKPSEVALPEGISAAIRDHKTAILAALSVASFEETVEHLRAMTEGERLAYAQALVHDLLAYAVVIAEDER